MSTSYSVTRQQGEAIYDSGGLPFNADTFQQSNSIVIGGKTYYQTVKYLKGGLSGTVLVTYTLTFDGDANVVTCVLSF
jgi:hypothetical protein